MGNSPLFGRVAAVATTLVAASLLGCGGGVTSPNGNVNGGPGGPIIKTPSSGNRDAAAEAGSGPGGTGGADAGPSPIAAQCATCEMQKCSTQAFIDANGGADFYGASCHMVEGNALQGPAMGVAKSQLCQAVLDCVHASGCAEDAKGFSTLEDCYCGQGVASTACLGSKTAAHGPCKAVIEDGAESTDPATVLTRAFEDPDYAAGAALGLVYFCDTVDGDPFSDASSPCASSCSGVTGAGGTTNNGGASGTGGSAGVTGVGGSGGSTGAGGGAGVGAGGSQGNSGGMGVAMLSPACKDCELGSSSDQCDPSYLTNQLDSSGDPVEGTFGCGTLASPAAQAACNALLACIIANNCTSNSTGTGPGDNPVEGCYCGPAPQTAKACTGGTGITGVCVTQYHDAAIADGKVAAGASEAEFAAYISPHSFDPTTAFGMADNIVDCAVDAPCPVCLTLVVSTGQGGGSAGGGSGAGGTGGSGTAGGSGNAAGATGTAGSVGAAGAGGRATGGTSGSTGSGGAAGTTGTGGGAPPPCPDLDHDGVRDCIETLAANAGFDQTAGEWTPEPATTATWTSADGVGNRQSGSMEVDNVDVSSGDINGLTTGGSFQCIPVTPGARYEVAVQAYLASGQGSGWAGFAIQFHFAADCTGPTSGFDFLSGQGGAVDTWQTIAGTTTEIPLGITSMALRLISVKPIAQASLQVSFDNVLVRAE